MVTHSRDHGQEVIGLTKHAALDRLENLLQTRVDLVRAVCVGMTQVFDILREVAEKEDVILADLTGDLNL